MTTVPAEIAALVEARAAGRCEYCHAPQVLVGQVFHIDHVLPRAKGGKTTGENLCSACSHCNLAKRDCTSAVDPKTGKQVPLFDPRTQAWKEHFRWSRDWRRLLGRTPVGRGTVVALDINARLLQDARRFWRVVGLLS